MAMPSDVDDSSPQVRSLIVSRTKWTLPSAKQVLTPPLCRLRDMAEVMMSVESLMQPIRCCDPMPTYQISLQFCISSPVAPSSPRELLGVGLYAARPALTMLHPENPNAQTPRGSSGEI